MLPPIIEVVRYVFKMDPVYWITLCVDGLRHVYVIIHAIVSPHWAIILNSCDTIVSCYLPSRYVYTSTTPSFSTSFIDLLSSIPTLVDF